MKFFILLFLLSLGAQATPHLSRQWSRSTLIKPHFEFRYLNRMTPILTDELVIQGNGVDGIKAFKRKSGNQVWALSFKNGVEGGAALDGDRLYFGANNGFLYCVDVFSGREIWKFELNSESLTRPIVQGNFIYHITGNNTLYSFDKKTGQSLWVKTNSAKSNMTVRGQTAPVLDQGVLYVGFSDGNFVAVNAQNGRELWSKRIGDDKKFNDVDATAVLTDKCLLVSSFANALYCLDRNSGSILWRHDTGGYNAVTVQGRRLYYPTINNEIHILDSESGKLLKKIVNLQGLSTEIISFSDFLIYGEAEGALVIRNQSDLKIVDRFYPGLGLFAKPTLDEKTGEIYFISNDANIYRMDFKESLENPFSWAPNVQTLKK